MRLFVGVELEEPVAGRAAQVARTLQDRLATSAPDFAARWVAPSNLHITLWFIGEVAEPRVDAVLDILRPPFDQPPFRLAVRGCGAFPPSGPPRVLWIGTATGATEMRELHAHVAVRLTALGFPAERRPYSPHLTIARVKDAGSTPSRTIRETITSMAGDCGESAVAAITLFRSRLSPKGSAYEPLLRVPLS